MANDPQSSSALTSEPEVRPSGCCVSSSSSFAALAFPITAAALTTFSLGYDAGVMSGAIKPMVDTLKLSKQEEGVVMGSVNVVAAFGALFASWLADSVGRVRALAATGLILFLGPGLVCVSPNFVVLILGRLVIGFGVGLAFVVAPLYASELALPESRGCAVSIVEILINVGILVGYASALLLNIGIPDNIAWRLVTGLASAPAVLVLLCCIFLPESPRWLVRVGRKEDAERVFQRLGASQEEADDMVQTIDHALESEVQESNWCDIFCPTPSVRRMLLAGVGIAVFQQASGSEALVYYTPTILAGFGIKDQQRQNTGALLLGLSKLAGACMGGPFLDYAGRRPGVLTSSIGAAASLGLLAGTLPLQSQVAGLCGICLFMLFFELGLAPGAFVLGTECYPVAIRAKGLALGMFTTRLLSGVVSTAFPVILDVLSLVGVLWMFFGIACVGVFWAFICVPETKNLTLEEVVALFADVPREPSTELPSSTVSAPRST